MPKTDTAVCRHHWKIEPAQASHSPGKCLKCGERRMFANSIDGGSEEYNIHADGATGWQQVNAKKKRRALAL